ncbi:Spy/CpxP family protein refolding chaperone [Nitrincola alkalisediminis]|uniref:Spy/CpxP family protein refolding chaperone n=1 Tax=Nitrincola alkalisediminis TaxID=1366656 RepID=UPI0018746F6B|nr:hypothetical protein [Nitrincola alkalisediminis]
MKTKIISASLVLLITGAMSVAAVANPNIGRGSASLETLQQQLNLTEEQVQAFKDLQNLQRQARQDERLERLKTRLSLSDEQAEQMKAMHSEHQRTRETLRQQHQEQLSQILTPEQLEQMQGMRGEGRSGHFKAKGEGRKMGRNAGPNC